MYGEGRAALADDAATAEALGWRQRSRSSNDPEILLHPRVGDPSAEPWIAPPGWRAAGCLEPGRRPSRTTEWTYLAHPGAHRYLGAMAAPQPRRFRVGLAGLGRVGGVAASVLAATPTDRSLVSELLVYDADPANHERWLLELGSIASWRTPACLPAVRASSPAEMLKACDVFVFAASAGVPPLGTRGDVRMVQLEPNRAILAEYLAHARAAAFTGLFLVVSDPVDVLSQLAFRDSNTAPDGRFNGDGLAPERIAGLGLGVMWARALAAARAEGVGEAVARTGAAFGPHSTEVIAFDDVRRPDRDRSARMSLAARECNFQVRDLGFLPFVGPGVSSVALTLPPLLAGRPFLGSVLLDGLFFGTPARWGWGMLPLSLPLGRPVREEVCGLHRRLGERAAELGLLCHAPAL